VIKEYISGLLKPYKYTIMLVLLGVIVTGSLTVYSRRKLQDATVHEQEANRQRAEAQVAWNEASKLKQYADTLKVQLDKADAKLIKLQAAVDKIQVPPKPGPAPEQKQQLIADLKGMGLELVVKPSTTISPSLVGITDSDGKTIWGWGKENLRVPFLEQKIEAQGSLIAGLGKAKDLAEKLADSRTKQADAFEKSADLHQKEADNLRVVVDDTQKALKAEKKKRILYTIGAAAGGYFLHRELVK
jgi:hypothetical protein